MKEARIGRDQPLIADDEAPEVPQPGQGPFHNPTPSIPPQFPAILMGRVCVVPPRGDERLTTPPGQPGAQGMAVGAPIRNQVLGPLAGSAGFAGAADGDRLEGVRAEGDFRRGRRVPVCSQRSTRASDQNQPLGPLAPFRLADFGPSCLAGMQRPSTQHSSQRRFCWSWSWAKKARQSRSNTPVSSQWLRRRQQVLGRPYRRGNSRQWAPGQRIQRIPSQQRRSATRGRPPRADAFGSGRWTRVAAHCSFVRFRHAMGRPPVLLGTSWRHHTSNGRF
jgi:hypothetical protein